MSKKDDFVSKEVSKICNEYLAKTNYRIARKLLFKLYLSEYDKIEDFKVKIYLLYKLIVAERLNEQESSVCEHVKQLKEYMDEIPNYKKDFTGDYLDMMSYYCDCEGIILNKEDLIEHYENCCEFYKKSYEISKSDDYYIRLKIAEFSLAKVNEDFNNVCNSVVGIHSIINNPKAKSTFVQMLCAVKEINNELHDKILKITNSNLNVLI